MSAQMLSHGVGGILECVMAVLYAMRPCAWENVCVGVQVQQKDSICTNVPARGPPQACQSIHYTSDAIHPAAVMTCIYSCSQNWLIHSSGGGVESWWGWRLMLAWWLLLIWTAPAGWLTVKPVVTMTRVGQWADPPAPYSIYSQETHCTTKYSVL